MRRLMECLALMVLPLIICAQGRKYREPVKLATVASIRWPKGITPIDFENLPKCPKNGICPLYLSHRFHNRDYYQSGGIFPLQGFASLRECPEEAICPFLLSHRVDIGEYFQMGEIFLLIRALDSGLTQKHLRDNLIGFRSLMLGSYRNTVEPVSVNTNTVFKMGLERGNGVNWM